MCKCVLEAVYQRDFARLKSFYGVTHIYTDPEQIQESFSVLNERDIPVENCELQQRKANQVSNISLVVNPHLAFIALCVACCLGDEDLVNLICNAGELI